MTGMTTNKFSPEMRFRAVRMVMDHEGEHPSRWQTTCAREMYAADLFIPA